MDSRLAVVAVVIALASAAGIAQETKESASAKLAVMEAQYQASPGKYAKAATEYTKTLDVNEDAQFVMRMEMFDKVMQKPFPADEIRAEEWLREMKYFIGINLHLLQQTNDKKRMLTVARFLGDVRGRMVKDYKSKATNWVGVEILMKARVNNPNDITNEVLKAEYDKAVLDNQKQLDADRLQFVISDTDRILTSLLAGSIKSMMPHDEEFISQVITAAHLPDDFRAKLDTKPVVEPKVH